MSAPATRPPLLGAIADDLTGATDLAGSLTALGMRTAILVGVPDGPLDSAFDAIVVALKSRSIPAGGAVDLSVRSAASLRGLGIRRIYQKYASTFDSTPSGNIGPVTEALQDLLGAGLTLACPAFPANGRTVIDGRLLVNGVPLAESPMQQHPLNPMTESDLVRVLGVQTTRPVRLVPRTIVRAGSSAVRVALDRLATEGVRHAIGDAADEGDLVALAEAVIDDVLVTGASGLATAIGAALRERGLLTERPGRTTAGGRPAEQDGPSSPAAVIAGSCSRATLRQIAAVAERWPVFTLDPIRDLGDPDLADTVARWAGPHLERGPVVIRSSADPSGVDSVVRVLGPDAGSRIEQALGSIAARLAADGVRRLVVAGGETSGSVVDALRIRRLDVGAEIEPGVPWVRAEGDMRLVLKSGNFGSDTFFPAAIAAMHAAG